MSNSFTYSTCPDIGSIDGDEPPPDPFFERQTPYIEAIEPDCADLDYFESFRRAAKDGLERGLETFYSIIDNLLPKSYDDLGSRSYVGREAPEITLKTAQSRADDPLVFKIEEIEAGSAPTLSPAPATRRSRNSKGKSNNPKPASAKQSTIESRITAAA